MGELGNRVKNFITDENTIEVLGKLSTITGGIAAASATVAVFVPITAPFTGAVAGVMGFASLASGAGATIGNCLNNLDATCGWGIASTTVSAIPFVGPGRKYFDGMYNSTINYSKTRSNSIEDAVLRAKNLNQKIAYSSTQSSGFALDRVGYLSTKGKDEC